VQYLEKFQGIKFQEPVWFKAGAVILNEPLNYLGQDNLVGARSIIATLAVQASRLHSSSYAVQNVVVLEAVHFPSGGRMASPPHIQDRLAEPLLL
jgi:hypothetical protein